LIFVTAEERGKKTATMRSFIQEHDVSHLFANFEYEVDELRRDLDLADALDGVSFELFHDQTVVEPGAIRGKSGPSKVRP
jgi:deoxyribodipyrimidine photo-lyase